MKTLLALLGHELRNARSSLLASACLTVVLLAILHTFGCTPTETATGLAFLWCFCTLQFAADSFATDLASGRLATRAMLPVSARALWGTKLAAFAASTALVAALGIALELAWQSAFGRPFYVHEFLGALPPLWTSLAIAALIGAAGMLGSLLVESSLTAMLLGALALAALWGLWLAALESVQLTGPSVLSENPLAAALAVAVALLAIGGLAFVRAQRKLGDGAVRTRAVLVGALVAVLGLAGTVAGSSWSFAAHALEDRNTQIFWAAASPDGRFIAFESQPILRGGWSGQATSPRKSSVWVLELETGARRLLASPGRIAPEFYRRGCAWTEEEGLRVYEDPSWTWTRDTRALRVRAVGGELREETLESARDAIHARVPDWAVVTRGRERGTDVHSLHVRWKGTQCERTFRGSFAETLIGTGIVLSPVPGRLFLRSEKRLAIVDLGSDEGRTLLADCEGYLRESPDGKGLILRSKTHTHILSTEDGAPLHEPWPSAELHPDWIPGDDRSHELTLIGYGRNGTTRILDLESGRELELGRGSLRPSRVADRGYVLLDPHDDLVWIDREGKRVKVLIDRE